jgi:hypothetical protein
MLRILDKSHVGSETNLKVGYGSGKKSFRIYNDGCGSASFSSGFWRVYGNFLEKKYFLALHVVDKETDRIWQRIGRPRMPVLRIRIIVIWICIMIFTSMRIRILPFPLMRIRILPFNLMRILIRILPLPFPQFWTLQCSKMTL